MLKKKSPPYRNALGSRLRQIREAQGLSQSDIARKLQLKGWDVERTVVTKIELHRRCLTDYELLLIAEVLHVTLNDIVGSGVPNLERFFAQE